MGAKEGKQQQQQQKQQDDTSKTATSTTINDNEEKTTTVTSCTGDARNDENAVSLLENQFEAIHLTTTSKEDDDNDDKEPLPPISYSLQQVAALIRTGQAKNVLVLSGAGVSCSAGIPDFRSPGTGLYDNLQKYNLPYPEAVFDLDFYRTNPQPFLGLARELWPGRGRAQTARLDTEEQEQSSDQDGCNDKSTSSGYSPTLTHSFLVLLHQKQLLLRNYSQNIDGLEYLAGLSEERLVECHGHFRSASCLDCGRAQDSAEFEKCKQLILSSPPTSKQITVPKCQYCGGYVKPDIVFFGEGLPSRFHSLLPKDVRKADLLIILGTSLHVAPVSMIPNMVNCPRLLVNKQVVGDLDEDYGDYVHVGDVDEAVQLLAKELGWHDELLALNASTRIGCGGSNSNSRTNVAIQTEQNRHHWQKERKG